jgi:hypothetical protein
MRLMQQLSLLGPLKLTLTILGSMAMTSLLIACGSLVEPTPTVVPQPADKSDFPHISPEELKKRLDNSGVKTLYRRFYKRFGSLRRIECVGRS